MTDTELADHVRVALAELLLRETTIPRSNLDRLRGSLVVHVGSKSLAVSWPLIGMGGNEFSGDSRDLAAIDKWLEYEVAPHFGTNYQSNRVQDWVTDLEPPPSWPRDADELQ